MSNELDNPFEGEHAAPVEEQKPIEEATDDGRLMAWEGVRDQPVLAQFRAIGEVTSYCERQVSGAQELIEEGGDPSYGDTTVTLTGLEVYATSLGLHLVGFFSGSLGPIATEAMVKLEKTSSDVINGKSDEEKAAMAEIGKKVEIKNLATMFGISFEEALEMVDGSPEDTPDEPVAVSEGSWAAGEDDEQPDAA